MAATAPPPGAILVSPTTPYERSLRAPFYTLYTFSAVSLAGLLLLFAIQKKKRHPTMISYVPFPFFPIHFACRSRIREAHPFLCRLRIYHFVWSLRLFVALVVNSSGQLLTINSPQHPSPSLAIAASAFSLAGIIATTGASCGIVIRMWMIVVVDLSTALRVERAVEIALIAFPWIGYFTMLIVGAVSATLHTEYVVMAPLGAYFLKPPFIQTELVLAMIFLSITMFFEAWTLFVCFLQPRLFRAGQSSSDQHRRPRNATTGRSPFDAGFVVRVLAFGGYCAGAFSMAIVSLLVIGSNSPQVYQSCAGLVVFLIFGSQRDILQMLHILPSNNTDFISASGSRTGAGGNLSSRSKGNKSFGVSRNGKVVGGVSIGVVTDVQRSPPVDSDEDLTGRGAIKITRGGANGNGRAWEDDHREAWGATPVVTGGDISMVSLDDGKSMDGGESGLGGGGRGLEYDDEEYGSKAELNVVMPTLGRR